MQLGKALSSLAKLVCCNIEVVFSMSETEVKVCRKIDTVVET